MVSVCYHSFNGLFLLPVLLTVWSQRDTIQVMSDSYPLRELRKSSKKKAPQILMEGQALTDLFPKSRQHLYTLERRGVRDPDLLEAFSKIYNVAPSAICRKRSPLHDNVMV